MPNNLDRTTIIGRLVLILLATFLGACSHVKPYCPQGDCPKEKIVGDVANRLILIGDAGASINCWVQDSVRLRVREVSSMIVFLGDNVYEDGYDGTDQAKAILDAQVGLSMLPSESCEKRRGAAPKSSALMADVLFIPGNHDWKGKGKKAVTYLRAANTYLNGKYGSKVKYLPEAGCKGPRTLKFGNFSLIVLDTEWWVSKKKGNWSDCVPVASKLEDILTSSSSNHHIVIAHHPLITDGVHGGFYDWRSHLFPLTELKPNLWIPLPIIGSLYPIIRLAKADPQDIHSDEYQKLISGLSKALRNNPPLVYAAGHDHSLQVHDKTDERPFVHLLSGSGSKLTSVSDSPTTLFSQLSHGYMVLDDLSTGAVVLRVYSEQGKDKNSQNPRFEGLLLDAAGRRCAGGGWKKDDSGNYQCQQT